MYRLAVETAPDTWAACQALSECTDLVRLHPDLPPAQDALNGAVTLDTNTISNVICDTIPGGGVVPEPGTVALLGTGLFVLVVCGRRFRKRAA